MEGWRSLVALLLISVFAFVSVLAEEVIFLIIKKNFVSSRDASSIFQASEVDEEEAEVPEESFTSTKEFKVSH